MEYCGTPESYCHPWFGGKSAHTYCYVRSRFLHHQYCTTNIAPPKQKRFFGVKILLCFHMTEVVSYLVVIGCGFVVDLKLVCFATLTFAGVAKEFAFGLVVTC